jgi:hypothetical protein
MNRRSFLRKNSRVLAASAAPLVPHYSALHSVTGDEEKISPYTNQKLPALNITTTSGLNPYSGPWTEVQAAHLLRRTLFGPTLAEIAAAAGRSLTQVVNDLLTPLPTPAPPLNVAAADTSVAIGQTWVTG